MRVRPFSPVVKLAIHWPQVQHLPAEEKRDHVQPTRNQGWFGFSWQSIGGTCKSGCAGTETEVGQGMMWDDVWASSCKGKLPGISGSYGRTLGSAMALLLLSCRSWESLAISCSNRVMEAGLLRTRRARIAWLDDLSISLFHPRCSRTAPTAHLEGCEGTRLALSGGKMRYEPIPGKTVNRPHWRDVARHNRKTGNSECINAPRQVQITALVLSLMPKQWQLQCDLTRMVRCWRPRPPHMVGEVVG